MLESQTLVADWLRTTGLPFVSSWGGLGFFDHDHPGFLGQIGVYGNRGANFAIQSCDFATYDRVVVGSDPPAPPATEERSRA